MGRVDGGGSRGPVLRVILMSKGDNVTHPSSPVPHPSMPLTAWRLARITDYVAIQRAEVGARR